MNLKKTLAALLATLLIGSSAAVTISALEPYGNNVQIRFNANTQKYSWTNKEGYTFSEGYKSSVWYENFTALEFSGNTRNDILAIAISQLGYHEGENDSEDYTGSNTAGAGNSVEYYRLIIPNWSKNSDEWCACFVNWCLSQAHVDYAYGEIGCWKWVQELKTRGMFQNSAAYSGKYTPQPADMIFFNWAKSDGTTSNGGSSHIGFVLYTTDTEVYTIEGNSGNQVRIRSYALDDPEVIGYGTPKYEEHTIEGIPQDATVPTIDHSYKDGMPRGEYVVAADGVNLKASPDSAGRVATVKLGSRVTLLGEQGEYAHVLYGDKEGYMLKNNLYLMMKLTGEDTLTFDANGGEAAPEALRVPYGTEATIGESAPTLEGDTFLGWSLVPHNYKVDYKAGDTLTLEGDATLYAVWEKRSLILATEALAKGDVAEFDRPNAGITNSSAIRFDSDSVAFLDTTDGDTEIQLVKDASAAWPGGVTLALSSTQKSDDPHILFKYAEMCESMRYAPVNADKVDYVILRIMDVSLYNLLVEVTFNFENEATVSASQLLKSSTNDWQYLVLDMTEAEAFEGALQSMRIDWTKAADAEGNSLLIDGIYFAANEAQKDAIVAGKYIYPAQETLPPPETEPETMPETAPETTDETSAESGIVTDDPETNAPVPEGGCASLVGASGLLFLITAGGAWMLTKKKD